MPRIPDFDFSRLTYGVLWEALNALRHLSYDDFQACLPGVEDGALREYWGEWKVDPVRFMVGRWNEAWWHDKLDAILQRAMARVPLPGTSLPEGPRAAGRDA